MSERQLKLGHRKEYKRKSKHTRNPSYYPRHLTKVRINDLDADYNIPVIKEVAATRGHAKKVISKNCATDRAWHYGYVKTTKIEKFINKYVGRPYSELHKAYNAWMAPVKNTGYEWDRLETFFKDSNWRNRSFDFSVDDGGIVHSTPKTRRYGSKMPKKYWKENAAHKIPDFGSVSVPRKCHRWGSSGCSTSNGTDPDYYKPRPLGTYYGLVGDRVIKVPVYHVYEGKDYFDWCTRKPTGNYRDKFREGTSAWHIAKKLEDNWVYVVIPSTKYAQSYQMMEHFVHHHIEEIPNPEIEKLQNGVNQWQHIVNAIYEGKVVTYQNSDQRIRLEFAEKNLLDYKKSLERAPRIVTMDSGYGQLTPLVKRCDYERAIKEVIE